MKVLYLIPARGGSKRIPDKNIKLLGGIPLINHTINVVRGIAADEDICVSTDSDEIIRIARTSGLEVPFRRPDELASDTVGSQEVVVHALEYYRTKGIEYDAVMLLQPTSPFRKPGNIREILSLYKDDPTLDMVVAVGRTAYNPYFSLFEENEEGYLRMSKQSDFVRTQDTPDVYFYNGSMYVINVSSLQSGPISKFRRVKKYIMDEIGSMDIDTPLDWLICETIINNGYFSI